jgi:phosphoglycolate phosphatase-like HAD superfamily hydrolase
MILVIFDIDGTLVDSNQVDEDCYVQALALEFGLTDIDRNWASYTHATGSGILLDIFQRHWGRSPTAAEKGAFTGRFLALLQECLETSPGLFREIKGAGRLLQTLKQTPGFCLGLATGDWRASAELKLHGAGLPYDELVFTSADDGISREEIVSQCLARVQKQYQRSHFSKTISVGDGVWDMKTAENLGLAFLGVGDGLLEQGAKCVVPDFSDLAKVLDSLRSCSRSAGH